MKSQSQAIQDLSEPSKPKTAIDEVHALQDFSLVRFAVPNLGREAATHKASE